jgi:hypothetical protein
VRLPARSVPMRGAGERTLTPSVFEKCPQSYKIRPGEGTAPGTGRMKPGGHSTGSHARQPTRFAVWFFADEATTISFSRRDLVAVPSFAEAPCTCWRQAASEIS